MNQTWQRDTFLVEVEVRDENRNIVSLSGATATAFVAPDDESKPAISGVVSITDAAGGKLIAAFSSGSLNFGVKKSINCKLQVVVVKSGETQTVLDEMIVVKRSIGT